MPSPPGFAECSYQFTQTGVTRPAYVTFGCDPTDTDPASVAASVLAAYTAAGSFNTIMDSTVSMTGVRVALGTDGTADLVYVLTSAVVGTGGSIQALPPNCAVLIHKVTARGGRRGRGRMYIPWCVNETIVDEAGVILAANVTTFTNAMAAWRTAMITNTVPLVLLHGPGKTTQPAPDPITQLTADRLIATQRRRLGR